MSAPLYLALLHHPVLNRNGQVVTTSVTNLHIHDIARSSRTYGVASYFVAHPNRGLRALCERVAWHWQEGFGARTNESRRTAMDLVRIVPDLDHVLVAIEGETGRLPLRIATSARPGNRETVSFDALRQRMAVGTTPVLILLGTGYGLPPTLLDTCDLLLEPLEGAGAYNHLSVRAAAAIALDRLRSARRPTGIAHDRPPGQ